MRTLSPAFAAHLASGATTLCTCWRLTRRDGLVIGFTDHDRPLHFDGVPHEPYSGADGSARVETADLAADNSEIEGVLSSDRLKAEDLLAGAWDGAEIATWRVNWMDPAQRMLIGRASLGEVAIDGERFRAELRGPAGALSVRVGRLFQAPCDARLGDARCGVDLTQTDYRGAGVVVAALAGAGFLAAGLGGFAPGWFVHGALAWTSGANAGERGHVKVHAPEPAAGAEDVCGLSLWRPPGRPVAPGDAFVVSAGCDRRAATCREKFDNLVNHRGFPHMPGNDVAIRYPIRTETNDGGRR